MDVFSDGPDGDLMRGVLIALVPVTAALFVWLASFAAPSRRQERTLARKLAIYEKLPDIDAKAVLLDFVQADAEELNRRYEENFQEPVPSAGEKRLFLIGGASAAVALVTAFFVWLLLFLQLFPDAAAWVQISPDAVLWAQIASYCSAALSVAAFCPYVLKLLWYLYRNL